MNIGAFSDTHGMHGYLSKSELEAYDMLIFAGDCSNNLSPAINSNEVADFAVFYNSIDVKYKIWIAGNHDTSIEYKHIRPTEICPTAIYLEHSGIEIEGIVIFGSPYTPSYGQWSFMRPRHKMAEVWKSIPDYVDILITHGPPAGVLDLTVGDTGNFEMCGDKSLLNRVYEIRPKLHIFGHIHNCAGVRNEGVLIRDGITFANVSCATDGRFGKLSSNIKPLKV